MVIVLQNARFCELISRVHEDKDNIYNNAFSRGMV